MFDTDSQTNHYGARKNHNKYHGLRFVRQTRVLFSHDKTVMLESAEIPNQI